MRNDEERTHHNGRAIHEESLEEIMEFWSGCFIRKFCVCIAARRIVEAGNGFEIAAELQNICSFGLKQKDKSKKLFNNNFSKMVRVNNAYRSWKSCCQYSQSGEHGIPSTENRSRIIDHKSLGGITMSSNDKLSQGMMDENHDSNAANSSQKGRKIGGGEKWELKSPQLLSSLYRRKVGHESTDIGASRLRKEAVRKFRKSCGWENHNKPAKRSWAESSDTSCGAPQVALIHHARSTNILIFRFSKKRRNWSGNFISTSNNKYWSSDHTPTTK